MLRESAYDRVKFGYIRKSVLFLVVVARIDPTCEYLQDDQSEAELRQGCSYRPSVEKILCSIT